MGSAHVEHMRRSPGPTAVERACAFSKVAIAGDSALCTGIPWSGSRAGIAPSIMSAVTPNYTYRAEWDPESFEYTARCSEFPGYYTRAGTAGEAVTAMEGIVAERIAELAEAGQPPPASLTDHLYSGRFLIRTSRALHARLTVEAAEQRVSLNQWVVAKLADRPRPVGFDDLFD